LNVRHVIIGDGDHDVQTRMAGAPGLHLQRRLSRFLV